MANVTRVNVNAGFVYQARARIPNAAGELATPTALGQVTGLKFRLCLTPGGTAIDPEVDDLTPTENATEPGLFEYAMSQALQQEHLLPLGRGKRYYGVWSKAGVAEFLVDTFVVAIASEI